MTTSGIATAAEAREQPLKDQAPVEGLRARRRRRTRADLHAATVRLTREHGIEHVTVEMISKEAGVSPRTFFNYFRTKETALFSWHGGLTDAEADQFAAAPGRDADSVLRDLGDVFALHVDEMAPDPGMFEDVIAVVENVPSALGAFLAECDAVERNLARAIARRTGDAPDGQSVTLLAGIAMTAVRDGLMRWGHDKRHCQGPAASVRDSFTALRKLFPSPTGASPAGVACATPGREA
ncbi:TetR/AcrR family transcriptional regulator [Streptomyces sp. NPDC046821]|uniref:TetR/AcrR family transcriptional regulator n=1 Tax=Streptomyces sp. NPDC046821 TaxID=3154702 RepID=UPI0033D1476F